MQPVFLYAARVYMPAVAFANPLGRFCKQSVARLCQPLRKGDQDQYCAVVPSHYQLANGKVSQQKTP
jgi:hypothetical protein